MKQDETKVLLREGAIRTVAREGLEKASTKLIAYEANVNEVFIFRYFGGKDNLLDETFRAVDEEIVTEVLRSVKQAKMSTRPINERVREVILVAWDYLMNHRYETVFFIRYYYSAAFLRAANIQHNETTRALVDLLIPYTKDEMAARRIVTHMFNGLLNVAMQVELGNADDSRSTREYISVMFSSMIVELLSAGEQAAAI